MLLCGACQKLSPEFAPCVSKCVQDELGRIDWEQSQLSAEAKRSGTRSAGDVKRQAELDKRRVELERLQADAEALGLACPE